METLGDRFWSIIDASVDPDMDAQIDTLGNALADMSRDEILAFGRDFERAMLAAYRWNLSGAALVINGGFSDERFSEFRSWLIAQGKAVYDAALQDPESLAGHIKEAYGAAFEDFADVVIDVYEAKFDEDYPLSESVLPAAPAGVAWDPNALGDLYPKLTAKVAELEG
ncbi:MAG: DUF4240 domain-containing protein [Pseudomonadota bacterium]